MAGSHLTSMHSMDNYYVSKLIPLIVEAGVHAIPNPLINIMIAGQTTTPIPSAAADPGARIARCRDHRGVWIRLRDGPVVFAGQADMLDVAFMGLACGAIV